MILTLLTKFGTVRRGITYQFVHFQLGDRVCGIACNARLRSFNALPASFYMYRHVAIIVRNCFDGEVQDDFGR